MSTTATHTVPVDRVGPVEVTIAEYGSGQPFLLLHGGAGPASVTGFAELFAATHDVRVLVPTHPGFGGTPRPDALGSIPGLAALYNTLRDQLDRQDVTGGVTITATPAKHGVYEVTFVLRSGPEAVYFAGDTMLIPELGKIPQRLGHISLALLPTNGLHIRPANNMQVVMNAQEAAELTAILKP